MLPTLTAESAGVELHQAGPYEVTKPACTDSTARLYLAKHNRLSRVVTLQELTLPDGSGVGGVAAFVALARDAGRLRSPHLAEITEFLEPSPGHFCCVMEPLFGETLRARINRGGVSVAEALEIVCQLTEALSALHAANRVHGCLTASRVFLADGERGAINVKLFDYGVGAGQSVLLEPDQRAPEQRDGVAADALTDVFFLGSLMSEMISATEQIPAALQAVVGQARVTKPSHRYRSVGVLCAAIIEALNPPYLDPLDRPEPAAPRRSPRWPIAALLVTIAFAAFYFKWPGLPPFAMEPSSSAKVPAPTIVSPPVAAQPPPPARPPEPPPVEVDSSNAPSLRPNMNLFISGALHQAVAKPPKPPPPAKPKAAKKSRK